MTTERHAVFQAVCLLCLCALRLVHLHGLVEKTVYLLVLSFVGAACLTLTSPMPDPAAAGPTKSVTITANSTSTPLISVYTRKDKKYLRDAARKKAR